MSGPPQGGNDNDSFAGGNNPGDRTATGHESYLVSGPPQGGNDNDSSAGGDNQLFLITSWAACQPHIPWTPPPGGVDDEHR